MSPKHGGRGDGLVHVDRLELAESLRDDEGVEPDLEDRDAEHDGEVLP